MIVFVLGVAAAAFILGVDVGRRHAVARHPRPRELSREEIRAEVLAQHEEIGRRVAQRIAGLPDE